MSVPAPNLDDRRFQDLVDDAKRLLSRHCPEWTDHNVSDPGVTLIEAFATMVDQLLYRLNRVPERHYIRFLDLIGVQLFPPVPARTLVTFWLSAPRQDVFTVPAGTEVATQHNELDEAVVFSTSDELEIVACELGYVATEASGEQVADRTRQLVDGEPFGCFGTQPAPGDTLYVGLSAAVPHCVVRLRISCEIEGIGVDPTRPPLHWQAYGGAEWLDCEVETDETGGFNRAGDVILHLPDRHSVSVLAGQRGGWLRCVLREPQGDQPFYGNSPRIHGITACTIGGTVGAVHAEVVTEESLGTSDGSPGQRFGLQRAPVTRAREPEVLEAGGEQGWHPWQLVADFTESSPSDAHFIIDRHDGAVAFGPALRREDGTIAQYGAVPPKGTALRMRRYHTGGGRSGNLRAHALSVLRTSMPYIARVQNRVPATGGVDGEDVASARQRAPLLLRTRFRAVTAEDYEVLAAEVGRGLARVRCVPEDGNVVRVLVVPGAESGQDGRLEFGRLRPSDDVLAEVSAYLDERRTLGARVVVEPPFYRGVTVVARLTAARRASTRLLRLDALEALHRYLHPLTGGPNGTGWPFGKAVLTGDLYALLQRIDGVDTVETVRLFAA
ncbi:MAG: putative baseplate assembly protein, partial [Sciscionella sp.]